MGMLNIYDLTTKKKTAVLQNAFDIFEEKELNNIYSLKFTLPATDEKVQFCLPRHFVRWGEDGQLYRIIKPTVNDNEIGTITYECEHVIATLCDKIMFGSYTYGGWNMKTAATIEWLLSQQTEQNWVLGECDFDRKFEYLWEQENILNALYSIPKEFAQPYMWTFDTTVYPWKLNLKIIDDSIHPEYYLRAKRNLLSSGVTENYADICTRIYPLGYGEGVNQLGIAEINNGVPYLQSPDEIVAQYGIIEKVLVDRRFEHAETLMAYAQTMLDNLQTPSMSRTFDVVDLYELTNDDIDNAEVGKIVRMTEDNSTAYITKTKRQLDKAGDLQIDLSTKTTDIASTIADLADRVRIESVYAQGATQLYQHSKDANATPEKGMNINLYFPSEMRQINKVLLKMSLQQFRSYSATTSSNGGFSKTYTVEEEEKTISSQTNTGSESIVIETIDQELTTDMVSDSDANLTTTSGGGATGTTSTSSESVSISITSGPSSKETTKSGGAGSDPITSKTELSGNVEYTTLETNEAGGVTNHQTTETLTYEKDTTEAGGVTNHQTTETLTYEKDTTEAGGVTNHKTTETLTVEKETTAAGGVTNHPTTETLTVEKETTAAGGVTNHQTTETLTVEKDTTAAGGVTNHKTTETVAYTKSTTAAGGVTNHQTTETLTVEKDTTAAGGVTNHETTETLTYTKDTAEAGGVTNHQTTETLTVEKDTAEAGGVTNHQTTETLTVEKETTAAGGVTNHKTTETVSYEKDTTAAGGVTNHQTTETLTVEKDTTAAGGVTNHKTTETASYTKSTTAAGGVTNHQTTKTISYEKSTTEAEGSSGTTGESTIAITGHTTAYSGKYSTDGAQASIWTNYAGDHNHNIWCSTGEVTPPASANYRHSHAINYTGGALSNGSHNHGLGQNDHYHGMYHYHDLNIYSCGNHSHSFSVPKHSHKVTINGHLHTVTISNHSHSVTINSHLHTVTIPNHTHKVTINGHLHTVTIPNHTHKFTVNSHLHTVTIPNHTHKFTVNGHLHTVTIPDHTHKFTVNGHLHTVTIPDHTHKFTVNGHLHTVTIPDHTHKFTVNGHLHTVTIPNHTHKYTVNSHLHTITIPDHTHKYTINSHLHTVTIPDHTHKYTVNSHLHTVTIPDHTHKYTVNSHLHTITIPDHKHKFTVNGHLHTITIPDHKHKFTVNGHLHTVTISDHKHTINRHRHYFVIPGHSHSINKNVFAHTHEMDHTHEITASGIGGHSHSFSIGAHTHDINIGHQHHFTVPGYTKTIECPSHTHDITIPGHSHDIVIEPHTHDIIPGIFENGNATGFYVKVNGEIVHPEGSNTDGLLMETSYDDDITQWLLDESRQIPRDSWINVEIIPNDLAYVVSSVFVQGFVQSRGGGNY